jgi:hypothetical protein
MQDFCLRVEHVPGPKNEFADALSRMFQETSVRDPEEDRRLDRVNVARVLVGREPAADDVAVLAEH